MDEDANGWSAIEKEERDRIKRRRKWLTKKQWGCHVPKTHVGLALSGGGIRSATFSLGLMRSLSKAKLIHSIDYLSTVSGGGYAGAFYCSLFVPNHLRGRAPVVAGCKSASQAPGTLDCDVLGSPLGREAISQLRQGGHYLAPNGTSDALLAAVVAVRNWFAVAITTGLALLGIFFALNFVLAVAAHFLVPAGGLSVPARGLLEWAANARFTEITALLGVTPDEYGASRLILTVLALWPAACAWAYWFSRSGSVPHWRLARPFSMQLVVALLIFALVYFWPGNPGGWHSLLRMSILCVTILSICFYLLAETIMFLRDRQDKSGDAADCMDALTQEDRVRTLLGQWLLHGTLLFIAAALLAAVYALAREVVSDTWVWGTTPIFQGTPGLSSITAILTSVLGSSYLSRWVLSSENRNPYAVGRIAMALPWARRVIALAAGTILLSVFITF